MNRIIAHIVCLDEIHKKNLIRKLPPSIKVIDLDQIQHQVYNCPALSQKKLEWENLTSQLMVCRKQRTLMANSNSKSNRSGIERKISKLADKRAASKKEIHSMWRDMTTLGLEDAIHKLEGSYILILGFSVFPKDYRIKISIPMVELSVSKIKSGIFGAQMGASPEPELEDPNAVFNLNLNLNPTTTIFPFHNRIFLEIDPPKYASNQIKFYLKTYSQKIIQGTFPLNLLKIEYLASKYEKCIQFYIKQGYCPVQKDEMINVVNEFCTQLKTFEKVCENAGGNAGGNSGVNAGLNLNANLNANPQSHSKIYLATLFRCSEIIPVNSKTPVQGFRTKGEAIESIRPMLIKNTTVFLYGIDPKQFRFMDGKFISGRELYPEDEESFILTAE